MLRLIVAFGLVFYLKMHGTTNSKQRAVFYKQLSEFNYTYTYRRNVSLRSPVLSTILSNSVTCGQHFISGSLKTSPLGEGFARRLKGHTLEFN
jgi:hypothetical protein